MLISYYCNNEAHFARNLKGVRYNNLNNLKMVKNLLYYY